MLKLRPLLLATGICLNAFTSLAAPIHWDGGGDGVHWDDPLNWAGDALPGITNDVTIDLPDTNITVTIRTAVAITHFQCEESLEITAGSLTLTEGNSQINGAFTIARRTSLTVRGSNTTVTATGPTVADGASFYALEGATLLLPGFSAHTDTSGCCGNTWRATGLDSLIRFESLTNLAGNPTWAMSMQAQAGARIELPGLTAFTSGNLDALADGTNSVIDLTALGQVPGNRLSLEARYGGAILAPNLTDGSRVNLTLRPAGQIATAQYTRLLSLTADGVAVDLAGVTELTSRGSISLRNGGTASLINVTNADGQSFFVSDGVTLAFPALTSYTDSSGCCGSTWEVSDAGSRLEFPALSNLRGNPVGGWPMDLRALAGGEIDLGGLPEIPGGAVRVLADGADSTVDLGTLSIVNANLLTLEPRNGGAILIPQLTDASRAVLTVRTGGTIATTQLTHVHSVTADGVSLDLGGINSLTSDGSVSVLNGGSVNLNNVTQADGASFILRNGATLSLPALRSYTDTSGCCGAVWEANSAGTLLSLPALTNLTGNPTWAMSVRSLAGGLIELNSLNTIPASQIAFRSDGSNSLVNLPALDQFLGGGSLAFTAQNEGVINTPQLTRLNFGQLTLQTRGQIHLPLLNNIDGTSLYIGTSNQLSLSNVTSFVDISGCCGAVWETSGADSLLTLPALTNLTGNPTWAMTVRSLAGGTVNLNAVKTIPTSRITFRADGSNSLVNVPALSQFSGGGPLALTAQNNGTVNLPLLTRLNFGQITLQTRGQINLPLLNNIDGTSLYVGTGDQLTLPNITTFTDNSGCCGATWQANGANSLLNLPALTHLAGNPVLGWNFEIRSLAGGHINLNAVRNLPDSAVSVLAEGTNSVVDLSRLPEFTGTSGRLTLEARQAGVILLDSLNRLNRAVLTLRHPGSSPTAQLRSVTDSSITLDGASYPFTGLTDIRGTTFSYSNDGSALFPPAADLAVTNIEAPGAVVGGLPLQLVWTVANLGTNAALGPRSDAVYLSTDNAIGNDQLMAHFPVSRSLLPGATQLVTNTIIVPGETVGNRFFIVEADSRFEVFEGTNEANNLRLLDQPVITSSADLVLDSVTAPPTATFGEPVTVTWQVRNAGSIAATAPWKDRLFLSTNTTVSPGALILTTLSAGTHSPLAPSATYTRTQQVTLPLRSTLSPGSWFVVVKTDATSLQAEANENNNTRATTVITVERPPLPDLTANAIVAPASATPGQPIVLSWDITNQGAATARSVWNGTVLLTTEGASAPASPIGFFSFTNDLPALTSLTRTQSVSVPVTGPSGSLLLGVELDTQQDVVESDEANNVVFASTATAVPATLTLVFPSTQTVENATSPAIRARVSRNGPLGNPLSVSLTSSDLTELTVPATVTIPAQVSSASFDLSAVQDGIADGPQTALISASAPDFVTASQSVVVADSDRPRLTLTVDGGLLNEGQSSSATLTRTGSLTQPLTVTLASSSPGQLNAPATVIIPAQETAAQFTVLAVDDYFVESQRTYTLSASAPGHDSAFAAVVLVDDDLPALTLSLAPTRVSEAAGPGAATLTITRADDTVAPFVVQIVHSHPGRLTVPTEVTFSPGQLIKALPISPVDNVIQDGDQLVTFSVLPLETLSLSPIFPGNATNLTLLDDDGPVLQLSLARDWLCSPAASNAPLSSLSAILRRRGETNPATTVTLAIDPPGFIDFPSSLNLGAGELEATFTLTALDLPLAERQLLTLTASAPDYAQASADFSLTPDCKPDLVISNIVSAPSGLTDEYFSVTFRDLNIGAPFAIVSSPPGITNLSQRVFLSTDRYPGGDTLLGAVSFDGAVDPYTFLDRSATFRLPRVPGDYWLIVEADASNRVAEASEVNNFGVAAAPIHVDPAYTATVTANPRVATVGTSITLSGIALKFGSSQPAPFEIVSLPITLRDTVRVIAALTDANGSFSATFTPLPGEAGTYTVGAAHPGVTTVPVQDTFTLLGMKATPSTLSVRLPSLTTVTQQVSLANLGDTPLTGLAASVVGNPPAFSVLPTINPTLAPFATSQLSLVLNVITDTNLTRTFTVRVTSAEGAIADVIVTLTAESLRPRLTVTPESLVAGVVPGQQRFVEFSAANLGGASSGPIQVLLPSLPFLRLASPGQLPSLAPGESNRITLRLAPAADAALGDYSGTLLLSAGGSEVPVPFSFRLLSTNVGTLNVEVTDQFTYYAEGAPRVTNAVVELRDPASGILLTNLTSAAAGIARFTQVTEGYYALHVLAPGHAPYRKSIFVPSGTEEHHEALLNREVVQFVWNVVPIQLGDRTRITIDAVFETVVPVPVVTLDPPVIDLADFPNGGTINLTITNHGLLAAQQTRLSFSNFDCWKITPLISDIGTLAARSSIVVPVTICRDLSCTGNFSACSGGAGGSGGGGSPDSDHEIEQVLARVQNGGGGGGGGGGGNCGGGALIYIVPCGDGAVRGSAPVGVANAGGDCPWHPVGNGGSGSGSLTGGASAAGGAPCDPCALARLKAIVKCAIKFIPLPDWAKCGRGTYQCATGDGDWRNAYTCAKAALTCAKAGGKSIPWLKYLKFLECTYDIITACDDLESGGEGGGSGGGSGGGAPPAFVTNPELQPLFVRAERLRKVAVFNEYLFGSDRWFQGEDTNVWSNWLEAFLADVEPGTDSEEHVSPAEQAALLNLPLPFGVTGADAVEFIERWNRSLDYWQAGIFSLDQVPSGQNTNFLSRDHLIALSSDVDNALTASEAEGYPLLVDGIESAKFELQNYLSQPSDGICARVRLRIDQEAVIARDAFRATLDIVNDTASVLSNLTVEVVIYGPDGGIASELFAVPAPTLSGMSAVDGTGRIEPVSTGSAAWNILPTLESAPDRPIDYYVGGSIRYTQDGVAITVPLALVSITVHPLAQLALTYFHQRDVLGDDPFTDEIEPSVPYSLAVQVRNSGKGIARNLRVTSAQPRIVDNEKGLFIDFQIIATEVAGQNLVPSLTANFGDIQPGSLAIGQWLFRSTLQGLFIDYSASFEHLDNLGDPRLSLIQSVDVRELIRIVRAPGPFADGLPDMLVNDIPDLQDLPDTLYLSDGSIEPVSIVQTGIVHGVVSPENLEVMIESFSPSGWSYVRIPEPSNGRYRLASILRSDQVALSLNTNVWITDRTFVGGGRRPVKENTLHLLDFDSPGFYTLVYEPQTVTDTLPPTSSVTALPQVSGERIPLIWSGTDNPGGTGIAFYDLFVSINNEQFLPWLEETPLTGSIYEGTQGNTYAFYSIATDLAGNRETAPLAPDAITGVNFTNTPPTFQDHTLVVNEGDTVQHTNVVIDPDVPPQTLSFSLLGQAPPGASVDSQSGILTWPTTEATGPSTNLFTIRVSDNGFPSYHSTGAVTVVVMEINSPPTLSSIEPRIILEGETLLINPTASDPDIPANLLTFHLAPGFPPGATVDPSTGQFSWRPTELQGGTTNSFALIVTDDGQPSLSVTQQFNVVVRDNLGDFVLSLSSTNLLAGQSNHVLLQLESGLELAQLEFLLEVTETNLSNLVLRNPSPEINSLFLLPVGPDLSRIRLTLNPGAPPAGLRTLAELAFETSPNALSAIVPLTLRELTGIRGDSQPVDTTAHLNGRVFLIGPTPILEAYRLDNGQVGLTLYGHPGADYLLEHTTDLDSVPWTSQPIGVLPQTFRILDSQSATNQMDFWRVRETP